MNGIDFIKNIRNKQKNNSQLKIILTSAFMNNALHIQDTLNNLKIDKIIEKSIRLELFKDEVKKLMDEQQQQLQIFQASN